MIHVNAKIRIIFVCNAYLFLVLNRNYRDIIFCFVFIFEPVALANPLYDYCYIRISIHTFRSID